MPLKQMSGTAWWGMSGSMVASGLHWKASQRAQNWHVASTGAFIDFSNQAQPLSGVHLLGVPLAPHVQWYTRDHLSLDVQRLPIFMV